MRFTHNDVHFDVTYESHQNWLKKYFVNILRIFDDHHVTSKLTSLCVNLIVLRFLVNFLHSKAFGLFIHDKNMSL